jgi:hypothetical protein
LKPQAEQSLWVNLPKNGCREGIVAAGAIGSLLELGHGASQAPETNMGEITGALRGNCETTTQWIPSLPMVLPYSLLVVQD